MRAAKNAIGNLVKAAGIPNSPLMIVKDVSQEASTITTIWFSSQNGHQEATFPSSALELAEVKASPKAKASKPAPKKKK